MSIFQKQIIILFLFTFGVLPAFGKGSFFEGEGYNPERGFVPNEETAIKIAKAVWIPIYGKRILFKKRPFVATLVDNEVWVVEGTLRKWLLGGVPYIEIRKDDGKILKVTHTK